MNDFELNEAYLKIESSLEPIRMFIENNTSNPTIKQNYKGFITLQGPLIRNPEILFLGINPGHGAFKEHQNQNREGYPKRIFDSTHSPLLDWYKDGNARGEKVNEQWNAYKWFERSKRINNPFVANMIDLLYAVAELRDSTSQAKVRDGAEPAWYNGFGKKLMFTNLYPIASTKAVDLNPIFSLLVNHPETKCLFSGTGRLKKWDVQRFFVYRIDKLVELVKPKVIVCLGTQSFNDFTYTREKKKDKIFKATKGNIPVIGIERSVNWSASIPLLAQEIGSFL